MIHAHNPDHPAAIAALRAVKNRKAWGDHAARRYAAGCGPTARRCYRLALQLDAATRASF